MMLSYTMDWWNVLSLGVSVGIPLLIGLLSHVHTKPVVQVVALTALNGASSFGLEVLSAHQAHTAYNLANGALFALLGVAMSIASHYGIWKPTGATRKALLAFRRTPEQRSVSNRAA